MVKLVLACWQSSINVSMSAMTLVVEPQVEEWAAADTDPEVGCTKLRYLLVVVTVP